MSRKLDKILANITAWLLMINMIYAMVRLIYLDISGTLKPQTMWYVVGSYIFLKLIELYGKLRKYW